MKIAKPMLLVTTPVGVFGSVYWAYQLAGGLVVLLVALFLMITAAFAQLIMTVRCEAREQRAHPQIADSVTPHCEPQVTLLTTADHQRR